MAPSKAQITEAFRASTHLNVALEERLAALEFALEDVGYRRLSAEGDLEFSRPKLDVIALACRMSYLKNPVINHAVEIQTDYVFGGGISVTAKDDAINEVLQAFMDDPKNRAEFTDPATMPLHEVALMCEGNDFLTLFVDMLGTGAVNIRSISLNEIPDIICDPQDGKTPWFYKRMWTEVVTDMQSGEATATPRTAYYADWRYETDVKEIGGHPVEEAKIMHVKVGGMKDMKFGVPELYSAVDWAKAIVDDMSLDMTIKRAQARWAQSIYVTGGATAVAAAKTKLGTTVSPSSGQEGTPPPLTASTFIGAEGGARLELLSNRSHASADEGRPLRLMAAAATGIPETMLMGDADVGNLATARTLDRPTELKMTRRQTLWKGVINDLMRYVVRCAVEAVNGPLRDQATVEEHPITGYKIVVWNDQRDDEQREAALSDDDESGPGVHPTPKPRMETIDVSFPNVIEHDPQVRADQAIAANDHGAMTDRTAARIILSASGVDDIDEELDRLGLTEDAPATGQLGSAEPQGFDDEGMPIPVVPKAVIRGGANGNGAVPPKTKGKPQRDRLAAALAELVSEKIEQRR